MTRSKRGHRRLQSTAQDDGFSAGLRTYGRNDGFTLYTDGELPMARARADRYLAKTADRDRLEAGYAGAFSRFHVGVKIKKKKKKKKKKKWRTPSVNSPMGRARSVHSYGANLAVRSKVANWGLRYCSSPGGATVEKCMTPVELSAPAARLLVGEWPIHC